ncbi:MAG: hypothetical protein ABSD82_09525 [Solirubrobacteraceae bacterium]|jgi:hypothetical protein
MTTPACLRGVLKAGRRCITSRSGRLALTASAYVLFAAGSTAAIGAPSAPTCRSGRTLFASGAVRAFKVTDSNENQEILVCASSLSEPVVIDSPGPATEVDADDFHIRGPRLGFEVDEVGEGAVLTTDIALGWVDLQTGEVAFDYLDSGAHDRVPEYDLISYAFAPDGTMAVIAGAKCEVVAVLPLLAKPFGDVFRLGPPQIVFTAHHGELVHWSIAVTATTVTWGTINGTRSSARWVGTSSTATPSTSGC